jgi:nitrogen fixation/metabolism regulation signal transduction histidine kinase
LDDNNHWTFESLKRVFQQKDQPNLIGTLSKLYKQMMEELSEQKQMIENAKHHIL